MLHVSTTAHWPKHTDDGTRHRKPGQLGAATVPEAFLMGSLNPARVLGIQRKGLIAADMDAGLVALDGRFKVQWTMVGREMVYTADL